MNPWITLPQILIGELDLTTTKNRKRNEMVVFKTMVFKTTAFQNDRFQNDRFQSDRFHKTRRFDYVR